MENKQEALEEIAQLTARAWRLAYEVSKGEMSGNWYELRMNINDLQCDISDMQKE